MSLMRRRTGSWDPFRDLQRMNERFEQMFNMSPWLKENGESEALAETDWAPSVNISETAKEYRIQVELPEVKKDDMHVSVDKGVLTIQGQRKEEKEEKEEKFHRKECIYGSFMRRFTLPDDADDGQIDAKFKDGMLKVRIPKSENKEPRKRHIAVS